MIREKADRLAGDALIDAAIHQQGFRQVRAARRQERVEDYLELISDLVHARGEARLVEIATRIGVAPPTVAKMLKRLVASGYAIRQPYRGIFLTAEGEALAEKSRTRHRIVESFLLALGIDADVARRDAEGIEHHVSRETLEAFRRFVEQQRQAPGD